MGFVGRGPWRWAWSAVAVLAGTAWQLQSAVLAPWAAVAAAVAVAVAAVVGLGLRSRVTPRRGGPAAEGLQTLAIVLLAAVFGHAQAQLQAALRLSQALPAALEGQDLVVTGVVAGLPRIGPTGTAFEFERESAGAAGSADDPRVPDRLSLLWPAGNDPDAWLPGPPPRVVAGDRWRLVVRLKRPHALLNPGGFDGELWMFERGLRATGVVRPGAVALGSTAVPPVDRLRQAARDAILLQVSDARAAGVLAALSVGDQAAIDRASWEVFRVTGVAHLMSISGLHVTMFAWLAAAVIDAAWRRWPRGLQRWAAPDVARWGGVLTAAGYAAVAGWGVPAQRTVGMLLLVAALRGGSRRWPWPLVAVLAAAAIAVLDPWALLQPGFWLSFVAVCLLMASEPVLDAPRPRGRWRWLREAARQQGVATVGLAPLTLVFFQQVSVVGAVANAVAIPAVTVLITPLALLGLLWSPCWSLAGPLVAALLALLDGLATGPWVSWSAADAPAWAVIAGLVGGAVLIMPLPVRLRLSGILLALPLLLARPLAPAHGEVEILAADVGQGTAVLISTRHHRMLYDAGPRPSPDSDAAVRVLLPLLRSLGSPPVDRLVLSHRDTDHIGGAESLLRGAVVHDSLSSLEPGHPLLPRLPRHARCEAGQHWTWDGVRFEVLHPRAEDHDRGLRPNGLSCVIRIVDRHGPLVLLTGDIEAPQELELVSRAAPGALRAPILLLPHHGSRTSTSPEFLEAVGPVVAIAQAGYRSRFGHPSPVVVARLARAGVALRRSDTCGAWTVRRTRAGPAREGPSAWGDTDTFGSCERDRRRRYWHHPG